MYRLRQAIRSPFSFQILLAGLLLCATNAVQAEPALPNGNDGKVQSVTAASRQLAVLLDEDRADPKGKRYSGFVVWRTETIQQTGETPDIAMRADIEIPERNLKVAISLRRNGDLYLSAGHKIEISFALPSNFSGGGVGYVQSVRMRPSEQARGMTLTSDEGDPRAAKKVSEGFIAFGLSDRAYNQLRLIDELSWLDIYMAYNNRRWAILQIAISASGREVFERAFTAWELR